MAGYGMYYPYPKSQGATSLSYGGMIENNSYYFIPVEASIHTHTPCRQDGSDGVSHAVGSEDKQFAAQYPGINHWVVGCGAIAQYNGNNNNFYNKSSGSLSSICN